jgi:integrase
MPARNSSLPPLFPESTLACACDTYLERRALYLRPRSLEAYHYHFRTLQTFFDREKRLSSFHEGDFRDYQRRRTQQNVGPSLINHELGALSQLLTLSDLWHPISKYYERLPERNWMPPKVLSEEEEERFFRFAARKSEWKTAFNAALVTSNTTVSGCELRTLRLENIRLDGNPPVIQVPETVKNKHRVRGVPLNAVAVGAIQQLLTLAKERGSSDPRNFLISFRIKKGVHDPRRPASPYFIRTAFRAIARSCGLGWVTPSCFRHQAITKLLERGAPDETVRAIAGHVSEKAMRYYSHIRIEAKKAAVDRLQPLTERSIAVRSAKADVFPLLTGVRETARQLGIGADAALELVLAYEHSKTSIERTMSKSVYKRKK